MRASDNLEIIVHLLRKRQSVLFYHSVENWKTYTQISFLKGPPRAFPWARLALHSWAVLEHWSLTAYSACVSPKQSSVMQNWNASPLLWPVGFQLHTSSDWTGIRLLPGLWRRPLTQLPALRWSRTSCSQEGQWFFQPVWPNLQQYPWWICPKPRGKGLAIPGSAACSQPARHSSAVGLSASSKL